MKMLFSMDEQVHHFKVTGEVAPNDLTLLKKSLFGFFDSNPSFVVLDLSEIMLQIPDFELQGVLTELITLGKSKQINLAVAQTDIEARLARKTLLEGALSQQLEVLQTKIELREKIRKDIEDLKRQNQSIKESLEEKARVAASAEKSRLFTPLLERLWGGR